MTASAGEGRPLDPGAPETGSGARVEARALSRHFGAHRALDALDLAIEPGETFGLLGANGAGKTTFIRLVTGYLLPTAGTLTVDGFSPVTDADAVHARLGFAAETSRLYPELRVARFLRFAGEIRGLSGAALDAAIERVLAHFELESVARRLVGNLSKGYQQRVSLAQAFLHDPPLLIVDEPTSGLDPLHQEAVRDVIRAAHRQRTILLCTHDLDEARRLADRVAVLHRGRLVAVGPAGQVLAGDDLTRLFDPHSGEARDAP
ncbi:MAG: ABC transporter ATP-binding protein [Myxococcales bacterium]|nr:ABC transporter ATP-binding protein [Myxococcales bacterium]